MKTRIPSRSSLKARIDTLRRRHREIDARIAREEASASVDMLQVKRLKQEKLGLRDAIHMTRSILARQGTHPVRTGWQDQFQTG